MGPAGKIISPDPIGPTFERVQKSLGEGHESATITTGKASDLLPEELVNQEQAGQTRGHPPELRELTNVRERTIFDRELADGQVFQRHKKQMEAIHEFMSGTQSIVGLKRLDGVIRSRIQSYPMDNGIRPEPHLVNIVKWN